MTQDTIRQAIALDVFGTQIREDAFFVDWRPDDTISFSFHVVDPYDHVHHADRWMNVVHDRASEKPERAATFFPWAKRKEMGFKIGTPRPAITVDCVIDAMTFEIIGTPSISLTQVELTHSFTFKQYVEAVLDDKHPLHELALAIGRTEQGLFGRFIKHFEFLYAKQPPHIQHNNASVRKACLGEGNYGVQVLNRLSNLAQMIIGHFLTHVNLPAVYLRQVAGPSDMLDETARHTWTRQAITGTLDQQARINELLYGKLSYIIRRSEIEYTTVPDVLWIARACNVVNCTAPLRRIEDCAAILQLATYLRTGECAIRIETMEKLAALANTLRPARQEERQLSAERIEM